MNGKKGGAPLRGPLHFDALQAVQVVGGLLRMTGRGENRPLVLFQHLESHRDVGGMVLADLRGQSEIGAKERGPDLGNLS